MNNSDYALEIKNLSISFGGLKAVNDLSFYIKKKEIFGLIGPNGAGKTTVFNCITQFYIPDTGEVLFSTNKGTVENLVGQKVHNIIRKGLVRTFQNVEYVGDLSLLDNVKIGATDQFTSNFFGSLFCSKKSRREEARAEEDAIKYMKYMGIESFKDMMADSVPFGVLKKMELARALMSNPTLLILDEPAAGLNDQETEELAHTIHQIRDDFGCTILLVEHDMPLVMSICDRICAINFGQFLACGTPEVIQKDKGVQEAYLGVSEEESHE